MQTFYLTFALKYPILNIMLEYLNKAKTISIVISDYENIDFVASTLVLFLLLKNKKIYYKINNNLPFKEEFKTTPQIIFTIKQPILDIYYEKTKNNTKLFLTPQNKDVSSSDLSYEIVTSKENIDCDLIISIGFKTLKALENMITIHNADIINIDHSHLNKRFGKVNLIENNASISKILFSNLEKVIDKNMASLLLAGVKQGEIGTIEKLTEKEGKLDTVYKVKSLVQVLNKMELKDGLYLSEIDDLNESDIPFILKIIKDFFLIKDFILLFNKRNCIFFSQNKKLLENIQLNFNAQIKNSGGIFKKENLTKNEILNTLI